MNLYLNTEQRKTRIDDQYSYEQNAFCWILKWHNDVLNYIENIKLKKIKKQT